MASGLFGGAEALHVSFVSDDGHIAGWADLETTDTGVSSGMQRVRGVKTVPTPVPGLNRQPVEGDDGRIDTMDYASGEDLTGVVEGAIEDFDIEAALQGSTVYTLGSLWDMAIRGSRNPDLTRQAMLITQKAKGQDTANRGNKRYKNILVPNVEMLPQGQESAAYQQNGTVRYDVTFNPFTVLPWGADLDSSNFTLEDGTYLVWYSDRPSAIQSFIGDGTAGAVTLAYAPIDVTHTKVIKDVSGVITIAAPASVSVGSKTATPAASVASGARGLIIYETLRFPN